MNGLLVIISSPSGGGKTSVIKKLIENSEINFEYSISATTRKPRPDDINGKDYIFLSEKEFLSKKNKGEFLEWEQVHQYYYGTPKEKIEQWLNEDKIVLLDIDVNGGAQIKQNYPDNTISIFIEPPSLEELIARLKNRKTDSKEEINKRLRRVPLEMEKKKLFDYIVVNDKLEDTIKQMVNIIKKYKYNGGCTDVSNNH